MCSGTLVSDKRVAAIVTVLLAVAAVARAHNALAEAIERYNSALPSGR